MTTIYDLIESFQEKDGIALSSRDFSISFKELYRVVAERGRKLLGLGLSPGDKVALLAENSPEWFIWSLSITYAGMVDVPRGEFTNQSEVNFILKHSQARGVIVENEKFLGMVRQYPGEQLEFVIGMKELPDVVNLEKVSAADIEPFMPEEATLAAIIYTSGTTGDLKGVMLSHGNFMSNARALLRRVDMSSHDKILSILPAWHSYERIMKYCAAFSGMETFYSNKRYLLEDLRQQNPTLMGTVPRFWEMIYDKIQKKLQGNGFATRLKSALVRNAIYKSGPLGAASSLIAKQFVFPKFRQLLGNRFRGAVSGGGAMPRHVEDMFSAAGIAILEGYGMTESSPVIAVRPPQYPKAYTVGPPLDNLTVKVIDPETGRELGVGETGVIHVRGPSVMQGYYRDFEQTCKTIQDGFLNTGDLGHFDQEGFLCITGRRKDLIVLSNGENLQPAPLESRLSESPYISAAIIVGQDWRAPGALLVPDFENLKYYCQSKKLAFDENNLAETLALPHVKDLFEDEVKRLINNSEDIKPFARIRAFELLDTPFEIGAELTATMKPRRHVIDRLRKKSCQILHDKINRPS